VYKKQDTVGKWTFQIGDLNTLKKTVLNLIFTHIDIICGMGEYLSFSG
jgi:hypothetical protein